MNPQASVSLGLMISAVLVVGLTAAEGRGAVEGDAEAQARVVEVRGGRAQFSTPMGVGTLVIVTAMSPGSGSFPVHLKVHAGGKERPISWDKFSPLTKEKVRSPHSLEPRETLRAEVEQPPMPPGSKTFHLMTIPGDVALAGHYRPLTAKLRALGKGVQVYVDDRDIAQVGTETLREIVSTLDEQILPRMASSLGRAPDVDGDGRFTVLISRALMRFGGGRLAVDGFVRGADFDPAMAAPFGNHCDVLYLSAALAPGPHLRTVLAHEYTHAVVGGLKAFGGPGGSRTGPEEEDWLDEGLAHLGEDRFGFSRSNLDYRVSAFLSAPERYRLVVDDYYAAGLFRGHGNRGSTYLFMKWCEERFGPDLLERLARCPKRGVKALEVETGTNFAELFRRWSVALATNGPSVGRKRPEASWGSVGEPDDWPLAGPRITKVRLGETLGWDALGTAPRFVLVEGGSDVVVEVEGPERADLQITALAPPAESSSLALEVHNANETRTGRTSVARLDLSNRGGESIRLERISWEPLVPAANPHVSGFGRGSLLGPALSTVLGPRDLPAHGRLGPVSIELTGVRPQDGPIVLKVFGIDSRGRRTSAWADFHPEASLAEAANAPERH